MRRVSEKKQRLINAKINSPLEVGEVVAVKESAVVSYPKEGKSIDCKIVEIDGDTIKVTINEYGYKGEKPKTITKGDIALRSTKDIGENPFDLSVSSVRPIAFSLESIIFKLNLLGDKEDKYESNGVLIKTLDWNPFVFDKEGKKQYFQRELCWDDTDWQLLVESIYQNIDCGKVLVWERSFEELDKLSAKGEKDLAFYSIVDGKQRLDTIRRFLQGGFHDMHGNYFADLSYVAQCCFTNNQLLSYAEMKNVKDEEVIKQFLKMNFTGVPQSKEHINFIKEISMKF